MVLFFTPRGKNLLYVGRDKFENEELIAHGLPCDVWFHVDNMSSAHVYLRLQRGQTIADISKEELEDAAQLTKANSILGHKASSVTVVYTPWANLRKTSDMEVPCWSYAAGATRLAAPAPLTRRTQIGQVGFVNEKAVLRVQVASRLQEVLNRLQKSRVERFPNLAAEKETYEAEERAERKEAERVRRKEEVAVERERRREAEARSYSHLQEPEKMRTNAELGEKYSSVEDAEEDFM